MPIRPSEHARYPKDWQKIRKRIQERAGDKCEWCGVPNHCFITRSRDGFDIARSEEDGAVWIICTTAHLNHIPEDYRDENLAFLCQKCHNGHDAKHRANGIKERANAATPLLNFDD
jgi:hypothetical protein